MNEEIQKAIDEGRPLVAVTDAAFAPPDGIVMERIFEGEQFVWRAILTADQAAELLSSPLVLGLAPDRADNVTLPPIIGAGDEA